MPRQALGRSLRPPLPSIQHLSSSICPRCRIAMQSRSMSASALLSTRLRREMFRWLDGPGKPFKRPLPNSTNYLNAYTKDGGLVRTGGVKRSDNPADGANTIAEGAGLPQEAAEDLMPFPMNRQFRSQPVLSEAAKDEIYKRVIEEGQDVRSVSADLGIEMRRVGAVVRLKAIERQWTEDGKTLALPYAKAVMSMLPQTSFFNNQHMKDHESINDLNVHQDTMRQVFAPAPESRQFNRDDAAKAFAPRLLSADRRIPHPELIKIEQWKQSGYGNQEIKELQRQRRDQQKERKKERSRKAREREETLTTRTDSPRWEFRFRDVSVEDAGPTGRAPQGTGQRYGLPFEDRKKGAVKIPTRVG